MKPTKLAAALLSTMMLTSLLLAGTALAQRGTEADLSKANEWLNSAPLSQQDLHGKVVLVEFWTFNCSNCRNTLPYVKRWYSTYKDQGFVIIGVHSPETRTEHDPANVAREVKQLGLTYPIAVDTEMHVWDSFHNQYWPAFYLFDANGHLRATHVGEDEDQSLEHRIQELLMERGSTAK